eukprot:scaffold245307_cov41-Prasinocladus_malaysianus.AAC.1
MVAEPPASLPIEGHKTLASVTKSQYPDAYYPEPVPAFDARLVPGWVPATRYSYPPGGRRLGQGTLPYPARHPKCATHQTPGPDLMLLYLGQARFLSVRA